MEPIVGLTFAIGVRVAGFQSGRDKSANRGERFPLSSKISYNMSIITVLLQMFARSLFLRISRVNRKNMIAIIKLIWRVVGGVS